MTANSVPPQTARAGRAALAIALAMLPIGTTCTAADYLVDPTGAGGAYTTIQAAITAVTGQSASTRANILIAPGTYREQLSVTKPYVTFKGLGTGPESVRILAGGTGWDPAVYVQSTATAFMATNLTFENQILDNLSQGLAVRSSADKAAYRNVRFLGYQDTLLVDNESRQYFKDVFITGDTDFIYGSATAVFDTSTIQSTSGGYVTAASTLPTTANGFVFRGCTLVAGTARGAVDANGSPASSAGTNSVYLGRPWGWARGTMASVIFIDTKMGSHIRTDGWNPWNLTTPGPNTNPDATSRYSEVGTMTLSGSAVALNGSGVPTGRVSWADPMTRAQADAYTLATIFGPVSYWNSTPSPQPEGTGSTYLPQGDGLPWDPASQLLLVDGTAAPPPTLAGVLNCDIGLDSPYSGTAVAPDTGTFWNSINARNAVGTITVADAFDSRGRATRSDVLLWKTADAVSGTFYAYSTAANSIPLPASLMQDYLYRGPYTVQVTDLEPGYYALYTFAHGDQPNQNSIVSLDAANGGQSATTAASGTDVRNLFAPAAAGSSYVVLDAAVADGQSRLTFTSSGYLNGFQLQRLAPTAITITVASGTQTQAQAGRPLLVATDPLAKAGPGTLVVDRANTISGSTSVLGGTLRVAHAAALAASTITPLAGGTLALTPGLTTRLGGLRPSAGGVVDVGDGMVTVAAGLSPADLARAIATGLGDGSWNGPTGIRSSRAATETGRGVPRSVGWLDHGDGSVTFAYAAPGDTNLDWSVDVLDAADFLAGNRFDSGRAAAWHDGDFTHDGIVDILDGAGFLSTALFDTGSYHATSAAMAVPEPTTAIPAGVIVVVLMSYRSRLSARPPTSFPPA